GTDPAVERVFDGEALGRVQDAFGERGGVDLEELARVPKVVVATQAVVERGARGHDAAAATNFGAVATARLDPEHGEVAGVGRECAGEQTDDGGLAGAVRAQQHCDRSGRYLEVEAVDRARLAERPDDAARGDDGVHV